MTTGQIRAGQIEDRRLAAEGIRGRYFTTGQLNEARRIQEKFRALGLAARSLGEIFLEQGILGRHELRELYRRISPDVDLPRIEGYDVLAKIGEGGMGAVYEARQTSLDRPVALKILHRALAEDELYLRRFMREARAVALLNHPHIVGGIDVGQTDELHYFVMELVEGQTVKEIIRAEGFMAERRAFEIARQMSLALHQASRHGLVHRDIKPENILITEEQVAKLCDLGLARPEGADDTLTQSGATHGTPYYMSPEQACGEALDTRSDIYALGVTLYEMVTGDRPFGGRTAAEVLVRQISERPTPPRRRNGLLSADGEAVILKMMAKRPAERYQTPKQLAADLEAVIGGQAPPALRNSLVEPTSKVAIRASGATPREAARGRRWLGGAALTLLAAWSVLASVQWWRASRQTPRERVLYKAGLQPQTPEQAPDWTARRLFEYARRYEEARAERLEGGDARPPAVLADVLARYREVVQRFAGEHGYWAFQARDRIELLQARERARAARGLEALRVALGELCEAEHYTAALARIARDAPAPARAGLEVEVAAAARTRLLRVVADASRQLQAKRPVAALVLLDSFLATRPPIEVAPAERLRLKVKVALGEQSTATPAEDLEQRLFAAFDGQRQRLSAHQFLEVEKALRLASAGRPTAESRQLRWLGTWLAMAATVERAARKTLVAHARAGRPVMLRRSDGEIRPTALQLGPEDVLQLAGEDGPVTLRLTDQPVTTVVAWAQAARPAPSPLAVAAMWLAHGRWAAGRAALERLDDPRLALFEALQRPAAQRLLQRVQALEAADKPEAALTLLEALLAEHAGTPAVAQRRPALQARRIQLRVIRATRRMKPAGQVLARTGAMWRLMYRFGVPAELTDWTLGAGWRHQDRRLSAPGGRAVLGYRHAMRPGARVSLELWFRRPGQPGVTLEWVDAEGPALRLEMTADGDVSLYQLAARADQKDRLLGVYKQDELMHGQTNLSLQLGIGRVVVKAGETSLIDARLRRPLRTGRLRLIASAGPVDLRNVTLSAELVAEPE